MSVIIVTGASRGIGKSITDVIITSSPDAQVIAVARSLGPLKTLQSQHGEERVSIVSGDLSESKTVTEILTLVKDKYNGQLNAIVANAGVLEPVDKIANANISEWQQLFNINFFSIVSLVSESLPILRANQGQVVLVSSGASTKGYYGWGAYGASKAALNHFAVQLASEEKDVKVIAVAPGVVDTQMQVDIRDKFGKNMTPEALKRFTDLKANSELLDPIVPATIYANLALRGVPEGLNGGYYRYNDENLESFTH